MVKFVAVLKSEYKRCVIRNMGPHSNEPGVWPSGRTAKDVCSNHMKNWKANADAQKLKLSTPKKKLWFLGKKK